MRRENPAGPEGAEGERNPFAGPVPRLLERFDAGLTRVGLRGPFSRDLLLGVFVALVSASLFYSVVVLARAEGTPLAPTEAAVLAALVVAQSMALCVRRRNPLLCLSLVVAAQVGIIALLPADTAFQSLASFFVAYTCGTVLTLRRLTWVLVAVALVLGAFGAVFALPPFVPSAPPSP